MGRGSNVRALLLRACGTVGWKGRGLRHTMHRITAQLLGPRTKEVFGGIALQDRDLVEGPNRSQYASFTWADLSAVAPWLEIPKKIDGPGLGNE